MTSPPSATAAPPAYNPGKAIGLRMGSVACNALTASFVKLASIEGSDPAETMFYRYAIAMPFILFWVVRAGGMSAIKTKRPLAQFTRGVIGAASMLATFLTVANLPLAEATTFSFTAPLIATVLSVFMLGERVGIHRWFAIGLGVVGMLIMIHPGGNSALTAAGIALGLTAATLIALNTITLRQLGSTESAVTTVFWFTLIGTVLTAIAFPFFARWHDPITYLYLGGVGVAAMAAQTMMTSALRYAPVSVTAPFEYSQLIWATLLGFLIWADLPSMATLIGAAFIAGAGLYTFYREHIFPRKGVAENALAGDKL
jgi:drug/metabolite transporter (DMT)-like permease